MGCDIHLHVEAKGDRWTRIQRLLSFSTGIFPAANTTMDLGWGEQRNYNAFAMLADVRNGSGFAGIDTGDGFEPIDKPRDLPKDVSWEVEEEAERWGVDGHSHSYFTLRELLDLETSGYWDKTTLQRGVMHRTEVVEAERRGLIIAKDDDELAVTLSGPPRSWAGAISGPGTEGNVYRMEFAQSYRDAAGWLLNTTIPALTEVADSYQLRSLLKTEETYVTRDGKTAAKIPLLYRGEPMEHWADAAELLRIVFWFDN